MSERESRECTGGKSRKESRLVYESESRVATVVQNYRDNKELIGKS